MIYLLPFLNAAFGWAIISFLFFFLFRPYEKRSIAIFEIQGFIPKNFKNWMDETALYVSNHFFSIEHLKENFLKKEELQAINNMLEEKVDDFLRNRLKEKIPILNMFITDGLIAKMKESLMEELNHMIPSTIDKLASEAGKKFDLRKMVSDKMSTVTGRDIEKLFYSHSGRSLMQLKLFAALLGFVLGCIEVFLLMRF